MLRTELSVAPRRKAVRGDTPLMRFHVFDGATRILIEVRSEDDARCLCVQMGWELICFCDD
jgi:hypothetical protein